MADKISGAELRAYREGRQLDQAGLVAWLNERLDRRYDRNKISAWETGSTPVSDLVSTVVRDALAVRTRTASGPGRIEPRRVCRRPFGLSHAALATSSA